MSERVDCKCGTKFCKHNKAQVWSDGGGCQSAGIAVLIVQGKLPTPDFSVISDTGRETQATWDYLDEVVNPAMRLIGHEIHRIEAQRWSQRRAKISLWDLKRTKDVLIPAFSTQDIADDGAPNKLKNFCTGGWKVEVVESWLSKVQGITRSKYVKWIGFSRDEQTRIIKMQRGKEWAKGLIRFPLVQDFPLTRRECIKLVKDMGWPEPPRSACWMCPNHSPHEWRKLKAERPDEFQKAVELEHEIHKVDPDAWLHRSCIPLDQVDFSQPEDLFSRPCDSGMCFV